jgi:hypothetical protein
VGYVVKKTFRDAVDTVRNRARSGPGRISRAKKKRRYADGRRERLRTAGAKGCGRPARKAAYGRREKLLMAGTKNRGQPVRKAADSRRTAGCGENRKKPPAWIPPGALNC